MDHDAAAVSESAQCNTLYELRLTLAKRSEVRRAMPCTKYGAHLLRCLKRRSLHAHKTRPLCACAADYFLRHRDLSLYHIPSIFARQRSSTEPMFVMICLTFDRYSYDLSHVNKANDQGDLRAYHI